MPYSTISSWVLLVAQALDAQGLDSAAVFREAGIDPDRLRDPGARFPVTAIAKVYRLSVAQTQDPAFGLEVARHWHPTTLHALGYSWMASATLRDAVGRFSRYGRMVTDGAQVEIVEGEHASWIEIQPHMTDVVDAAADAAMAVFMHMCRLLLGDALNANQVMMKHAAPSDSEPYRRFFRTTIEFDAPRYGLLFDNSSFDVPLATANTELARANDQVIVEYLAQFDKTRFAHRVRSNITSFLPAGDLRQEKIARTLNVSLRSLQRRLAGEGTNFQRILDGARRELALRYIEDERYSVSEIAYMLGYSEAGNLTKAFRRWYGCSPQQWRRRKQGQQSAG